MILPKSFTMKQKCRNPLLSPDRFQCFLQFFLILKRLVVGGFERVFEINRNFRNEGISVRQLTFMVSLILSAPVILYQVWAFIAPVPVPQIYESEDM